MFDFNINLTQVATFFLGSFDFYYSRGLKSVTWHHVSELDRGSHPKISQIQTTYPRVILSFEPEVTLHAVSEVLGSDLGGHRANSASR